MDGSALQGGRLACALVLFACACPVRAGEAGQDWRFETRLGYAQPGGAIGSTFGGGFVFGWAVSRRFLADLAAEGAISFASLSYAHAGTVSGLVCIPIGRGLPRCSEGEVRQRGDITSLRLGLALPVRVDEGGRALRLGAGVLSDRYSIAPSGQGTGSTRGFGPYVQASADIVPIGSRANLGLSLRGALVFRHGGGSGTAFPSDTTDRWWEINVFLALGRAWRAR